MQENLTAGSKTRFPKVGAVRLKIQLAGIKIRAPHNGQRKEFSSPCSPLQV